MPSQISGKENIFASPALPSKPSAKKVPKTPEECIAVLEASPMVEMTRKKPKTPPGPIPMNLEDDTDGDRIAGVASKSTPTHGHEETDETHDIPYFRKIVSDTEKRFLVLIEKWGLILLTEAIHISIEVHGEISSVIGQAHLLIDKRFTHFCELIDDCVFDRGERKTGPSDLQGYWDMVYFQVEDVDKKFRGLDDLQANNWVQKSPPKKPPPRVKVQVTRKLKQPSKSNNLPLQSKFAQFRSQMKKKAEEKTFDGVFFQIKSPTQAKKKEDDTTSTTDETSTLDIKQPTANDFITPNKPHTTTSKSNTTNDLPGTSSPSQFKEPPVAIVTPQRRYLPVVPSPLLHDITPKDNKTRKSKGRVSLSLPFSELRVEPRRSSRCTPSLVTVAEENGENVNETTSKVRKVFAGETPVSVVRKSYPKTPIPAHESTDETSESDMDENNKLPTSKGDNHTQNISVSPLKKAAAAMKNSDTPKSSNLSHKRTLDDDDAETVIKRRRTFDVEAKEGTSKISPRVTRSVAKERKRYSASGKKKARKNPQRRSTRLGTSSGVMKVTSMEAR